MMVSVNSYARNLPMDIPYIIREQFGIIYYGISPSSPLSHSNSLFTVEKLSECPDLQVEAVENTEYQYSASNTESCTYTALIVPSITCEKVNLKNEDTILPGIQSNFYPQLANKDNIFYSSSYIHQREE